jgi:hypothetical protein
MDPSGHIENDPDELFRVKEVTDELEKYGITVNQDWGWKVICGRLRCFDVWSQGSWTLQELEITLQAVKDFAAKISNELNNDLSDAENFRNTVGSAHIYRITWMNPSVGDAFGNTIRLYNSTFYNRNGTSPKETIVHELGHVWEWNIASRSEKLRMLVTLSTELSVGLDDYTQVQKRPTSYAETNSAEHWAETVAVWIYPEIAYRHDRSLSPKHEEYVLAVVHGDYLELVD